MLYEIIDASPAFVCPVAEEDRSFTTLCFDLGGSERRRGAFLAAAEAAGLTGLDGHTAVQNLRVALHPGHLDGDIERLADFLDRWR